MYFNGLFEQINKNNIQCIDRVKNVREMKKQNVNREAKEVEGKEAINKKNERNINVFRACFMAK